MQVAARLPEAVRRPAAWRDPTLWMWLAIWIVTRALIVAQVGFWNKKTTLNFQDVEVFKSWSEILAHQHIMPPEETWQYPPGAAFLMLAPRLGMPLFDVSYQPSFVATMLAVDLVGLGVMVFLARRTGRNTGVWIWLLALPLLQFLPVLRFDLAPTVLAMAALLVIHRRPGWFGALVGVGTAIKIWPVVVLFGEWNRRRLVTSVVAAIAAVALFFIVAAIPFGDQSGFLGNQNGRGLQVEAVAGMPWYARQVVTGVEPPAIPRSGAWEIDSSIGNTVAKVLKWLGLLVLVAAGIWWVARERAIRRGRTALADAAVSRDFVFTIILLQVVVSRVLSPQYMIWLVGLAAVVLSGGTRRMSRPAWLVIGAVVLTAGVYQAPANMLIRNFTLLVASVDAGVGLFLLLRGTGEDLPDADALPSTGPHPEALGQTGR